MSQSQMHRTIAITINKRIYFRFFTGVSVFLSSPAFETGPVSVFVLSSAVGASVFLDDWWKRNNKHLTIMTSEI